MAEESHKEPSSTGMDELVSMVNIRRSVESSFGDEDSLKELNSKLQRQILSAVLSQWSANQKADHWMRKIYGTIIIGILGIQLVVVNVYIWRLGLGLFPSADPITSRIVIVSVFVEVAGLVLAIIRYLFPQGGNDLNSILKAFLKAGDNQ